MANTETSMKAIMLYEYGDPEVLKYEDVAMPTPGEGQVLLKIEAVGINFAETMQRRNSYLERTPLPSILGSEVAGTVEALGPGVENIKVGARVLVLLPKGGGYAQYATVSAKRLFELPSNLGFTEATTLIGQGVTAYDIIKRSGQLKAGESILVHAAAGGVGVYAVQLAKLLGASKVIATASTAAKLELAHSLGADVLINYTEPDWVNKVKEATDGQGADVILEMVGGEVFNQNLKCLALNGRMVIFGAASSKIPTLNPVQLMYRNHAVIGYWLINTISQPQLLAEGMQALLSWIGEGKLKIKVDYTFPLSKAAEAHSQIESRQTTGKVVLLPHAE